MFKLRRKLQLSTLFLLFYSCTGSNPPKVAKASSASYLAVHNTDTAWLDLTIKGSTFKGKCAISYDHKYVDSGEVRGLVRGDTLLGDFHYLHYGLEWKRIAFALLKKNDRLIMGEGGQAEYFNIPYFKPEELQFDSVRFVFEPLKTP